MVGERVNIRVIGLSWDYLEDGNVEHLAKHDVLASNAEAVLANSPLFFRNVPGHRATHVMIGTDNRGRSLYISLAPTPEAGEWKPMTGWRSGLAHRLLEREGTLQ